MQATVRHVALGWKEKEQPSFETVKANIFPTPFRYDNAKKKERTDSKTLA